MSASHEEREETIFERIDDARRARDAAARLCARSLTEGNMESAQWQARAFLSHADALESLMVEMDQLRGAREKAPITEDPAI